MRTFIYGSVYLALAAVVALLPHAYASAGSPQRLTLQKQNSQSTTQQSPQAACDAFRKQSAQLLLKRDYPAAVAILKKAVSVCPNRTEVLLELSRSEMLSEEFDAAASTLKELLAESPKNAQALMTQGELQYLVGQLPEADASLLQAIDVDPMDAKPHYLLGRVYFQQSELKAAELQFETSLHLNPDLYKAYDGLALCYENTGDLQSASASFMKGIQLVYKNHPSYGVIYADFAELMLRFRDNRKAFDLAFEAARREPHVPRNFLLAGIALEQDGHYKLSIRWLSHAAQMDPTYPAPHYQLARVYRQLGEVAKSQQEARTFSILSAKTPLNRR